eukprot:jgi/Ulvmu1/909/UM101_0018.1
MEDGMRPVWSKAVCQAIAHQESMPELAARQVQYVRYAGSKLSKPSGGGWERQSSDEAASREPEGGANTARALPGAQRAEHGGSACQIERSALPQSVQLIITDSPAEFCLPQPRCRAFKPHFQAKVCIRSNEGQAMHMPIRVKAFAISRDDRGRVAEWSPPEITGAMQATDRANILGPYASTGAELKGPSVISFTVDTRPPAQREAEERELASAEPAGDCGRHILQESHSIVPRKDDPDMIAASCVGTDPATHTSVLHFNFKGLEFAHPTRMSPVWMVFACLVGKDLLYTLYDVPSICISRTNQRGNALARLGLPRTAFDDVDEARWKSQPEGSRNVAGQGMSGVLAGFAPPDTTSADDALVAPGSAGFGPGSSAGLSTPGLSGPLPALADVHMASGSGGGGVDHHSGGVDCARAGSVGQHMDWQMGGPMSSPGDQVPFQAHPTHSHPHSHPHPHSPDGMLGQAGHSAGMQKQAPTADWALMLRQVYMSDAALDGALEPHMGSHSGAPSLGPPSAHWDASAPDALAAAHAAACKRTRSFDAPDHDSASSPSATKQCLDRRADSDAMLHGLPHCQGISPMSPHGHSSAPAACEDMHGGRAAADSLFESVRTQTASSQTPGAAAPLPDNVPLPSDVHGMHEAPWPAVSAADSQHASCAVLTATQSLPPYPQGQPGPGIPYRTCASETQLAAHFDPVVSHSMRPPPPPTCSGGSQRTDPAQWPPAGNPAFDHPQAPVLTNRAKPLVPRNLSHPPTSRPSSPAAVTQPVSVGALPASPVPPAAAVELFQPPQSVSQEQVYKWVVSTYMSAGLKRRLSHHEYKVLLSFAGFPAAAGVDLRARIEPSQFNAFRGFFSGALRIVKSAQRIWDHGQQSVICGFGVTHHNVSETLSMQPVGTFLCYLSMPPVCELVIACKVTPQVPGSDKGHVLHVTVTEDDMHRLGLEQIIIGLPYATHLLDSRTGHRIDKRGLLPASAVSVRLVFAALVADEGAHDPDNFPPSWGPKAGFPDLNAPDLPMWGGMGARLDGVVGLREA